MLDKNTQQKNAATRDKMELQHQGGKKQREKTGNEGKNRTAHDKANGAERGVHQHREGKKRNYSSV